jgi:hypothetical protein
LGCIAISFGSCSCSLAARKLPFKLNLTWLRGVKLWAKQQGLDTMFFERPCTKEELLEVLKAFANDESLGLDGWMVEFFIHFFDLIGDGRCLRIPRTKVKW